MNQYENMRVTAIDARCTQDTTRGWSDAHVVARQHFSWLCAVQLLGGNFPRYAWYSC